MQRKLKGVADPDQEPLGGPSREQSPLERGSSGAAASDPLEAGGGGAAPQAGHGAEQRDLHGREGRS